MELKLLKSVSVGGLFQTFITRLVKNMLRTDLVQAYTVYSYVLVVVVELIFL